MLKKPQKTTVQIREIEQRLLIWKLSYIDDFVYGRDVGLFDVTYTPLDTKQTVSNMTQLPKGPSMFYFSSENKPKQCSVRNGLWLFLTLLC